MEDTITDESLFKKGKMTKDPFDMTLQELEVWKEEVKNQTREYLFSIGQPLVYEKDGQIVVEYADGTIKTR